MLSVKETKIRKRRVLLLRREKKKKGGPRDARLGGGGFVVEKDAAPCPRSVAQGGAGDAPETGGRGEGYHVTLCKIY